MTSAAQPNPIQDLTADAQLRGDALAEQEAETESGYGNDTGFATEATRSADPEADTPASTQEDPGTGAD